jgi:hypothetical protein
MAEAAKEIRYIAQILESMGIVVKKPIIIHVNNIGAIFMSENASATNRTRHVDARYNFVREFVEEGFLKVVFVKSKENKSDIFTKSISGDLYDLHAKNYVSTKEELCAPALDVLQEGCWSVEHEIRNTSSVTKDKRIRRSTKGYEDKKKDTKINKRVRNTSELGTSATQPSTRTMDHVRTSIKENV